MKMWIAKGEDNNSFCLLFKEKPYKYYDKFTKKHGFKVSNMWGAYMCLPGDVFPEVTFKTSPQQVEIKLIENEQK